MKQFYVIYFPDTDTYFNSSKNGTSDLKYCYEYNNEYEIIQDIIKLDILKNKNMEFKKITVYHDYTIED